MKRRFVWAATTSLTLLAASLPVGGCAKSEQSGSKPTTTQGAAVVTDLLVEAPAEWPEFLDWATREVAAEPAAVPLPADPCLPEAKWSVVRLEERLRSARIQCDWQASPVDAAALVTLGPLRSDQPAPNLRVRQLRDAAEPGTWLSISQFAVPMEEIGVVEIEISQPTGTYFDLIWARAGKLRVPIPGNDRAWTLNIATDGFAEWNGVLRKIGLFVPGISAQPIEIRSIRFLRRAASFPEAVGVRRVSLEREARHALYAHSPAEVRFDNITLPPRAKLQMGLAQISDAPGAEAGRSGPPAQAATDFEVLVEHAGERVSVLMQHVTRGDQWIEADAALNAWAGQTVSLILKTTGSGASVACWGNPVVYEPIEDAPCVIVYLIDALGAKHVNLYGYERPTTPRLTNLAGQGTWFFNMFANSPRTIESIPDLMLSLPTERHRVYHASVAAPLELVTLPEVLRAAGFATVSYCTNVNAGPRQNMDQGFDHFVDRIAFWWSGEADRTVPIEDVMNWLTVHRDRPTFLYIHTAEPHAPYTPPEGYAGRYGTGYEGRIDGTYDQQRGFRQARTSQDIAHVVALYDEEINYADMRLGAFLDALSDARLRERVHMFVIADHGEEFSEHGFWEHERDLYNELMRIPLVAVGPMFQARGRQETPAQLLDIMPTILDMYELPVPYALAGHSLLPLLVEDTRADDPARAGAGAVLQTRPIIASNFTYSRTGVIEFAIIEGGRWKLLHRHVPAAEPSQPPTARFELYDVQQDYHEKNNLIDTHQDVARRLVAQLLKWRRSQARFLPGRAAGQLLLDGEQLRELRALGYIE
ncbi:MAG: sulfatase-like hydrolase/transferase [Planctomycetes bacterium]|nr:sulfatase-like hydrolase/transferase [Planctomycetota bacterium]